MIVGILSDTHGQHQRAARAVEILQRRGASIYIHCGDVGGEQVFDVLAGLPVYFVWGNCDVVDPGLERYVRTLGLPLPSSVPLEVELDGRRLAIFHGHEPQFGRLLGSLRATARVSTDGAPGYDYILSGHTHVAADERIGATRLINPGALHRAARYTVATLDLSAGDVRFWRVP